ncbi:MAG: EamA family transporter, partial [Clostridia bacterium]|nr:EamA family transporter [Clostridia bacterium]
GLENNCTRRLSERDPCAVVTVKGLCSGGGALVIALCLGEALPKVSLLLPALLLGFVAYGLSIFFYVTAQRTLGAARTSAFYAVAPYIGVLFSFLIFRDKPGLLFLAGFLLMLVGTYFAAIPAWKERKTT